MDAAVRIEPNPKWIRAVLDGRTVVDSRAVKFVWERPYYPSWYVPAGDVHDPSLPTKEIEALPDHVRVRWDAVDHWFEEDVEVFVHPRDPHTRVDALASSRQVRVIIEGTTVAESTRPTILFETGLPRRFYLPPTDVRLDLLTPTDTTTACPYKGWASYWTATIDGVEHPDVVWSYRTPLPESRTVAGLMCFFDEKVDVEVDGVAQDRPRTPFS
ncbi:MAG: DUF427 domain-containing protein [Acidimicrobiales bacterium]